MSDSVEAHRARRQQAAIDAMAHGQAAFGAGDLPEAERWLDRARRVAGGNDAIELLLATVRLRRSNPAAMQSFATLALRHDLREAWLGLAAARHRAADPAGAAQALGEALSGHIGPMPQSVSDLADAIARAVGAPGWCCLTAERRVRIGPVQLEHALLLDGAAIDGMPKLLPVGASLLAVRVAGGALLGSPFQLARMTRLEGFVEPAGQGASGWAWHPNEPEARPVLRAIGADGAIRPVPLAAPGAEIPLQAQGKDRPLARPCTFSIAAAELPVAPVRVVGADGRDLPGSPLDPLAFERYVAAVGAVVAGHACQPAALALAPVPAAYIGRHRPYAAGAPPPATVVVPVYRGLQVTTACLHSVCDNTPAGTQIVVIDDASPEPALAAALDELAAAGRVLLIRHARNLGFPAAANAGLRAASGNDAVLLNADTLVPPGWLGRLRAAAYGAADIGTVTPLSNDATLLSYPRQQGDNPVPTRAQVNRLDRLADRANRTRVVEIPTAVGFCMYIRRDCLDQVGLLREEIFAQGYGEENDFCLRARHLGWRHVAAAGVFVGHVGGVSFGAARARLLARNLATLNRLHPGYDALIADDAAGPALALARRRLDLAVLAERRRQAQGGGAVVLITHDLGGGVQRQVDVRCASLRAAGEQPIVIRPILALPLLQGTGACRVELDADLPNLVYDVATELAPLCRLLAGARPRLVEVHHMLGHDHGLMELPARLKVPYEVHVHDYAWFCPRVTLVGAERRYCGEPDIAGCEACIADAGRNIDEDLPVAALVARSAVELSGAARVLAPSADVAARCARHFPRVRAQVQPWDDSRPRPLAPRRAPEPSRPRIVGVLGAIGIEKGYDVLLACARDATARALPLRFVVLGHTTDDARLLAAGHVFITGEYAEADLPGLIEAESVELAFLPSIWPETWCFTLSEAWRAGLAVVAFDIGAPAERIRAHGGGYLLPLACRAPQVNAALLG